MDNNVKNITEFFKNFKEILLSGYIWMVEDKKRPSFLSKENVEINFDDLYNSERPFNKIQEAFLANDEYSIHIKNIDGEEKIFVFTKETFDDKTKFFEKNISFPSHIENIKSIDFVQVYKLTQNKISAECETWQPIVKLFKSINY